MDQRGHKYLDAGNPALSAISHSRAREEELSQEILEKLDWIKGVRVSVQLPLSPAYDAGSIVTGGERLERKPVAARARNSVKDPAGIIKDPRSSISSSVLAPPLPGAPAVAMNHPLTLDREPPPAQRLAGAHEQSNTTAGTPGSTSSSGVPSFSEPSAREGAPEYGRVWVKVPRSYYFVSMLPGHKELSLDELQKLVARTEEQVRTGIALVVPITGAGAWKTTIDVIPDEVPLNRPPVVSSPPDSRRVALDWGIAGAVGAMVTTLVTFGLWILNARRTPSRPHLPHSGLGYHRGLTASSGPSERMREFVRRNPEYAVSVLERWTSQGADLS
jgi:hypothetical protein